MGTSEAEVAFAVHNPGDPVAAALRGTVFYTEKFDPRQHRAVLLLHGGTLDRRFWDGFNIPGAVRFAAELASHSDTAVFTVDRLVLLRVPRLNAFDLDAEPQPPHRELAQPVDRMRRRERQC